MSLITAKLHQLRGFFIVYFVIQFLVDIVLGWDLMGSPLGSRHIHGLGHLQLSRGAFLTLFLLGAGVLFALGLWFFQQLLRRKNWARLILLIVAWLTVADAFFSFLFVSGTPGLTSWLHSLSPGLDWHRVILVDRVKDFLGLVFWGYLIYVLQFNKEVKGAFHPPTQTPS